MSKSSTKKIEIVINAIPTKKSTIERKKIIDAIQASLFKSTQTDWYSGDFDKWYSYANRMKASIQSAIEMLEKIENDKVIDAIKTSLYDSTQTSWYSADFDKWYSYANRMNASIKFALNVLKAIND